MLSLNKINPLIFIINLRNKYKQKNHNQSYNNKLVKLN